jgi:phosphatidylinositol dimannoside acyltransferase
MKLDPRSIINSPFGLSFAYMFGKYMPYRTGQRFALFVADWLSARKSWRLVRAVRCNQWVVNGEHQDKSSLDKCAKDNFRNIASSIFDLYHHINNPAESLRIIDPHPAAVKLVQRPEFDKRGLVLVGVHMSNFDLVFQTGGLAGIKALALTLPELSRGYIKQWEMRMGKGINFTPVSVGALKRSVEYLKDGGMVITALDRPDPNYIYRPLFFGHPAAVPITHIFLALKAHVPVMVVAPYKHLDGKYHFFFSDPIEMQSYPDRHEEIMINAENILRIAEEYIRHDPSQWAMTFPVWPEIMDQVPE